MPVKRHTVSRFIQPLARAAFASMALGALGLTQGNAYAQATSPKQGTEFVQCPPILSLEKRLQMERWAPDGECKRPTRARITDFYLGYSCLTEAGNSSCRAFVPRPESRDLDTAKGFRCLELSLTFDGDGGYHVNRLREWATLPTECEWDPNLGLLAMEVDFDENQVCTAGACIPFQRLTGIGRARLKYLVISAFRENGVTSVPELESRTASSTAARRLFAKRPSR